MTEADIAETLLRIMRDAFRRPNLDFVPDQPLREIFGIDSVQFVTLIMSLEEEFGLLLPEDKVDQLSTVQSLFDLLQATIAASQGGA